MRFRQTFLPSSCASAIAFGLLLIVSISEAGEPIRFSKPAIPLAAPTKEPGKLPAPRNKGMVFSAPDMQQPMAARPPEPIVVQPGNEKPDDRHWLLRTPKMFSDPAEQKPEPNKLVPDMPRSAFSRPSDSGDTFGTRTQNVSRALSPVTDLNWDARDSNRRSKESGKGDRGKDNRYDSRTENQNALPDADDVEATARLDGGRPNLLLDIFNARKVEKPNAFQLERKAAFDQLINPTTEAADRMPNSLQPVVSPAQVVSSGAGMPTLGQSKPFTDPTTKFNQRHDRSRGSAMDEMNRKSSAPLSPAGSTVDSRFQTPLNRQPAVHDFPKRIQ